MPCTDGIVHFCSFHLSSFSLWVAIISWETLKHHHHALQSFSIFGAFYFVENCAAVSVLGLSFILTVFLFHSCVQSWAIVSCDETVINMQVVGISFASWESSFRKWVHNDMKCVSRKCSVKATLDLWCSKFQDFISGGNWMGVCCSSF